MALRFLSLQPANSKGYLAKLQTCPGVQPNTTLSGKARLWQAVQMPECLVPQMASGPGKSC